LALIRAHAAPPSTVYHDPFSFCRAVKSADSSGEGSVQDRRYQGLDLPRKVLSTLRTQYPRMDENGVWRCMGGKVYACYLGASGRACMKTRIVRKPTAVVRGYCAQYPNTDVPNAANDTFAEWICRGTKPILDTRCPQPALDPRGYLKSSWLEVRP